MSNTESNQIDVSFLPIHSSKHDISMFSNDKKNHSTISEVKENKNITKLVVAGVCVVTMSVVVSHKVENRSVTIENSLKKARNEETVFETVGLKESNKKTANVSLDINVATSKLEEEGERKMDRLKLELTDIQKIEDHLFVVGLIVGSLILLSPLLSNVTFSLSIPASIFGYSAMIPKIRSRRNYG